MHNIAQGAATPADLPRTWRERAASLRTYGAEPQARTLEVAADELAAALERDQGMLLSLEDAARESGYSADHLGKLIRRGQLRNAGRQNAPRIRRADLPRKVDSLRIEPARDISRRQIARSVVTSSQESRDGD